MAIAKKIKAIDNWYPCFPNNEVEISIHHEGDKTYLISIYGGDDDFAMEREFKTMREAMYYFSVLNDVSVEYLKDIGFIRS